MSSRTLVTALAALPVVVSAAVLVAVETARGLHPQSHLFARPAAPSLAEALDSGDLIQAHALLEREPGVLLWVSHPALTGGTSTLVSPLLWAAGTGNDDAVRMLLGMGHDMSRGSDRYAACLARAAGKTNTAELLVAYGNPPDTSCPALDAGKPPLTALLQYGR
jgi:hypothetical protein